MTIAVLGTDFSAISEMKIGFGESIRISAKPGDEWNEAFFTACDSIGLDDVHIGWRFDLSRDDEPNDGDVPYIQVRREIQIATNRAERKSDDLLSRVQSAIQHANDQTTNGSIGLIGAELTPTADFVLTVNLPVEIYAESAEEFELWCGRVAPMIVEAEIASTVGIQVRQEKDCPVRYYLTLNDVVFHWRSGNLIETPDYIQRIREVATKISE